MEDFVVIGKIADTYGLDRELKVLAYLPPKEWKRIKKVYFKKRGGDYVPFELEKLRPHGERWVLIKIKGVQSQEDAIRFLGAKVFLPKENLPKRKKDEYYFFELEGLEVKSQKGKRLGRVRRVFSDRDRVYLEIEGGKVIIPFIKEFVLEVKPKEGYLVVSSLLEELFQ
jgi:16S rRNA processing protein RimM